MKRHVDSKIFILTIASIIINLLTFILVWLLLSEHGSLYYLGFITYKLLFATYFVSLVVFDSIFDSFAFFRRKIIENAFSLSLSCIFSSFIFYFLDTLAFRCFYSPLYILVFSLISFFENSIVSYISNKIVFLNYISKKVIVFYSTDNELKIIKKFPYFDLKFKVLSYIKNPNKKIDLHNVDSVFLTNLSFRSKNYIIKECIDNDISIYFIPSIEDILITGGKYIEEFSSPMFEINFQREKKIYLFLKRFFDIIISLIALFIFFPLMIITAFAIKMYDKGPIIYKQTRLTYKGKEFSIYKFRSMIVNAEKDGKAVLTTINDNRITPIGKIIRTFRIDELPQLINIIFGDMSIVGPRPERPEIAKQYEKIYPSFSLRLQAKAGLTGYAQVYGKYNSDPSEKLKMDLFYINHRSIIFDLRLCIMTIKILFMKDSTEAFSKNYNKHF